MGDDWRVKVDLDDEAHGYPLTERLRALDLDDEVRERLGGDVIVSRDGPRLFLYAGTEEAAREAERVVRDVLAAEDLTADISVERWHPAEQAWRDPSVPLPRQPRGGRGGVPAPSGARARGGRPRGRHRLGRPGHAP